MAYLTERFAKQESSILNNKSAATSAPSKVAGTETGDVVENANFHIAKNLAAEKSKFIRALAQFPATALWLLNKYEKSILDDEVDEEDVVGSDQQNAISAIKKQFFLAYQAFVTDKHNAGSRVNSQLLSSVVQEFPFTFENLIELADCMIHALNARGLHLQSLSLSKKQFDLLATRLESLSLRNKGKLISMMADMQNEQFSDEFLFLTSSEMSRLLNDFVVAEQHWLENRQKLASANTRLVLFIANQYKGGFLDFDDLVQEGQTGLLKAVDRFNYQLGFQFSTYAGYWIRQAISRALTRCERVVRLPFGQMATINKVFRAKEELISKLGKEPTRTEIAEHVGLSVDEINTILSISQTAMAFDSDEDDEDPSGAPANFIEQGVFGHCFCDIAASELQNLICGAISTLNEREAKILCSHFGINKDCEMTLQEIGVELNLTRERVRQIQVMALNKIRLNYGEQLMSFL